MTRALTAWWWHRQDNYGDVLNPVILSYVSGRPVDWAEPEAAEIVAIGSVMATVRERVKGGGDPIYVWGTGMMKPMRNDFIHGAAITLVRGPLTATQLRMEDLPYGDPGLLTDRAIDLGKVVRTHRYGIIAHWTHTNHDDIRALADGLDSATLIPMQTGDVTETTRAMAACEVILSSSLHGLIVADSLGLPNLWIDTGRLGDTTRFKFFDYALGVGRVLDRPHDIETLLANGVPEPDTTYFGRLSAVKDTIEHAFPAELAA